MLTKEGKEILVIEKAQAKSRAKEVWGTVQQLEKLLKTYRKLHTKWRTKFEQADRILAEEESLTIISNEKVKKNPSIELTKQQLIELAEELGISLDAVKVV